MTKRLTLVGVAAVAVVWGPYVYAELARRPLPVASPEPEQVVAEPAPVVAATPVKFEPQPLAAAPSAPALPNLPEPAAVAEEPPPAAAAEETVTAAATDQRLDGHAALAAATEQAAQPTPAEPPKPSAAHEEAAAEAQPAKQEPEPVANKPAEEKPKAAENDEAPTPESLAPAFRSAFDRESRDAQWASSEEPRLTELLSGAGVPASAIAEVRCQSTVCRIALNQVDVQAVQQSPLYHLLYQRVRDEFGPMLGLDPTSRDGEQHAALYVLRKGYELPSSRDSY